jgi:hypothetical protein
MKKAGSLRDMKSMNWTRGFDSEAIKKSNPLPELLLSRGVQLRASGIDTLQGKCPFHREENGESLCVWPSEDRWHCFGKCGEGGDVIAAVMRLDGVDFKAACEMLGGRVSETHTIGARPIPKSAPDPAPARLTDEQLALQATAVRALAADPVKVAERRGWMPETVRGLALDSHLGIHEKKLAFIFPHGVKLRWQEDGARRIAWAFGGNRELWRQDRLDGNKVRTVYVTEGETDAISLLDAGAEDKGESAVVAIPGASCWRPEWNPLFAGRDVVVVTDADGAGEKAAQRILTELGDLAARVSRLNPLDLLPEDDRAGAKDISDAHQRLGRDGLRAALDVAVVAALNSTQSPEQESTKSSKYPPTEPLPLNSEDIEDSCSEDSPQNDPFPIDCLPGAAGAMARETADAALVPATLTAMNVLGILSAAIGAGLEVDSGGDRRTRSNLFLLPVAASGTGKGQSFGLIAEPFLSRERERLDEWRRTDRPHAAAEYGMAETRLGRVKSEAKKALSADDKAMMLTDWREAQAEMDAAERGMQEPAWSTEQATLEAVQNLLAISSREQLASLSAEARGALDTLMGRYRESTDESIFLAGYSGDPTKVHRKNSKPIVLNRPCLTLLWATQPDKVIELLDSVAMSESGLLPRFLLADTKAEPQEEPEVRHCVPAEVKADWAALIDCLLDEYHEPDIKPRVIQPEPEAAALLRDYANEIVRRRRRGGDLGDVTIYAARWAENAWRLAVVIHAAEHGADAWQEPLSLSTAGKAVRLMRWFANQQLLILSRGREERLAKQLGKLREVLAVKPNRQANLSELSSRHGFTVEEVQRLASHFPTVMRVEKVVTSGAGRPPVVARLI